MNKLFLMPVVAVLFFVVLFMVMDAFAQESGILVQTNDNHYDQGDAIVISGQITKEVADSTLIVLHLFAGGNLVDVVQITVAKDGSYSHTMIAKDLL